MKRVSLLLFVGLSVLMFYLGCDGAEPEPTPTATPEPTPEPGGGFDCDFVPDESGEFYTEDDCTELADAFGCADFNFQGGICEVFGCEDCLCNSISKIAADHNADVCSTLAARITNCFDAIFDDDTNECHLFVCVQEAPCGPFDILIP
jgi:hypothetical protein